MKDNEREYTKRKHLRLKGYDYSKSGSYYVTLCTYRRHCLFGSVVGAGPGAGPTVMEYSFGGKIIDRTWNEMDSHFNNIQLGEFIIMPNHIHGIIHIQNEPNGPAPGPAPTSLFDVIHWFKTKTTNEYIRGVHGGLCTPFEKHIWQRSYYEHIIRNEKDLDRIQTYIRDNPANWVNDKLNTTL